jgi:hypothetical protein
LLLFWLALTDAVPAFCGHIAGVAEGEPDSTRIDSRFDRLLCGPTTNVAQDEVVCEHATIRLPELIGNG